MRATIGMFFLAISFSTNVFALPNCNFTMVEGTSCKIDVKDLHPGQSSVGMRQIKDKVEEFSDMTEKKLQKYLKKKPVPVVLSPTKKFYMVDKHHMSRAFLEIERDEHVVFAEIQANWTDLGIDEFWQNMRSEKYVWLFDENGVAFSDPNNLPEKVADLKDDPYRSLAWAVREEGAFEDTNLPFAELLWANYFRPRVKFGTSDAEFKKAVEKAMVLAHDEAASDLPGYIEE